MLLGVCVVLMTTPILDASSVGGAIAAAGPAAGQSRCATIDVGQTIAEVGDKISAAATRGEGWTAICGSSWSWGPALPVGKVIGGCTPGSKKCTIRVTQPTGGPLAWCISSGVGGPSWSSCAAYVVLNKGQGLIEGYTKNPQGDPVPEVVVDATGAGGAVGGLSGTDGFYALPVNAGTYTVAAKGMDTGQKASFSPRTASRSVKPGGIVHADFTVSQQNTLTITFSASSVAASGMAAVKITITDTSPENLPVTGARIVVEPPVEVGVHGVANGLLCNGVDELASPVRLNAGTLLGRHFTAVTNSSGQVNLTLYLGTIPGRWVMDAYQPGPSGAPIVSQDLAVTSIYSGSQELPIALISLLHSQPSATLGKAGDLQRNVLEWLAQDIMPQVPGLGYAPIHTVSRSGSSESGVVIYNNTEPVQKAVLSYLDGSGTTPPPETEAVVIDTTNTKFLVGVLGASGDKTPTVGWRLPSLQEWGFGGKIQIALPGQTFSGGEVAVPEQARGRAEFGLAHPVGNEDMLYGYGPYVPAPSTAPAAVTLEHCLGA